MLLAFVYCAHFQKQFFRRICLFLRKICFQGKLFIFHLRTNAWHGAVALATKYVELFEHFVRHSNRLSCYRKHLNWFIILGRSVVKISHFAMASGISAILRVQLRLFQSSSSSLIIFKNFEFIYFRDLDRERAKMEQQEKKVIADIKKMAKLGQMVCL